MSTTTETPQEALDRIQRMGFCNNDVAVVMHFANCGIDPDDIDPRHNVLTFRAWKALGRAVAKGAISFPLITWIDCKPSKKKLAEDPDAKGFVRKKITRVFHISQTVDASAPKGTTRPDAWNNPALVKAGTYEAEPQCHESTEPLIDVHGMTEADNAQAFGETPAIVREETLELNDSGDLVTVTDDACTCPMAGVVTNVRCPLHGGDKLK